MSQTQNDQPAARKPNAGRRAFLKASVTIAPLAAASVATGTQTAEAAAPDLSQDTLQDTAQTRAYYNSARF